MGSEGVSEIQKFYAGRSLFLTGVTGFLGKALLEKLLRSCPEIKGIYVLMRPKYGSSVDARLKTIFQSPIFDVLKSISPDALSKVHAVSGDISQPGLGLCPLQRLEITRNVSVVIHSAASIKFNEPLKVALNINYHGTRRILKLAHEIKDLAALVYVSTAYSNCDKSEIKEEIVPPSIYLQDIDSMDDETVTQLTPMIIENKPNTYTYTKFLAESLLQEKEGQLPICIVRPSIIGATWKEPQPGFVDSLNGCTGVMAAIGKGVLTSLCCEKDMNSDIIPLDVVVNLTIASAWNTHNQRPQGVKVYNCCSGSLNRLSNAEMRVHILHSCTQVPFNDVLRYPSINLTTSATINNFLNILFNLIPFFFLDAFSVLTQRKPRMLKMYKKMAAAMSAVNYFHMNEWTFTTQNMLKLTNLMGKKDRELFFWNIQDLSWSDYIYNYSIGIKKWIFKEDLAQLPAARVWMNRMFWLQKVIAVVFLLVLWNYLIRPYGVLFNFKFNVSSLLV